MDGAYEWSQFRYQEIYELHCNPPDWSMVNT